MTDRRDQHTLTETALAQIPEHNRERYRRNDEAHRGHRNLA